MRLHSWTSEEEPKLGDLVWETPLELHRGFEVVGVEETSKPGVWWLTMERLHWGDYLERVAADGDKVWSFTRDR